jgi:hypothetical protein
MTECCVVGERLKFFKLIEIADPGVADCLGNRLGQDGICKQQPAPWRYAVGLVIETLRKKLSQFFYRRCSQQLRMNSSHPIGAMRSYDCQVRHADLSLAALFDQTDPLDAFSVVGISAPNIIQQTPIDLQYDLQVAREHRRKPFERPFLQGFW